MRRCLGAVSSLLYQVRCTSTNRRNAQILLELHNILDNPTKWIPLSQLSSLLSDETREALVEMGGLNAFCSKVSNEEASHAFEVKNLKGILHMRRRRNQSHFAMKDIANPQVSQKLLELVNFLPDKMVSLESCQRAWGLSTLEEARKKLADLLSQIETALREGASAVKMNHYAQVGYHGENAICVAQGFELCKWMMDEMDSERFLWKEEDFAPMYDLWRLSRYLRTDVVVPIGELLQSAGNLLQTHLLQVAMTYPTRIALQLGGSAKTFHSDRVYINGSDNEERFEVVGLKFVLSEEEISQHLVSANRYTTFTDEEIQEERVKLKSLPQLRRQKKRRSIVREEFRRKFPQGNPFLNPDVVALYLYDTMEPGVLYNNTSLRESFLPDGGKSSMHVGVDFFDKFPHLFITHGITSTTVNVIRRELDTLDDERGQGKRSQADYSDDEILLTLLPRLSSKPEGWGKAKDISLLFMLLPREMFLSLRRHSLRDKFVDIFRRYPEAFEVWVEKSANGTDVTMFRFDKAGIEKLGVKLVNNLQAKKMKSEEE